MHQSLPHGNDLTDFILKQKLESIFAVLANNADKLAPCATTRENESFNNIMASKAPKARHYSSSSSLETRLECAVAQKNVGHSYLNEVFSSLQLSPGKVYQKHAAIVSKKLKCMSRYKSTTMYKRRRLNALRTRCVNDITKEMREGKTYESCVDLDAASSVDIESIPKPVETPLYKLAEKRVMTTVFFDVETTSLKKDCDLIQLSACSNDDLFSRYIMPTQSISSPATEVTGITFSNGIMRHHGSAVEAVTLSSCLCDFIEWLKKYQPVLLAAHNCKRFDSFRLLYHLSQTQDAALMTSFLEYVGGFADTLPMFRSMYKGELVNYKQETIATHVLGTDFTYEAHNASADVTVLQKVVGACKQPEMLLKHGFSVTAILQEIERNKFLDKNLPTLQPLIHHKICGTGTVRKIAASGLSLYHLKLAHSRSGDKGLELLLGEHDTNNFVRVTRSKRVISSISKFISQ